MPTSTPNVDDLQQVNTALAASETEWQQQFAAASAADARESANEQIDEATANAWGAGFTPESTTTATTATDAPVATDGTATSTVQEQTPPSGTTPADAGQDPASAGSDVGDADDKATPSDGSFVATLNDGQEVTLTLEQLQGLVELGGWAQALPNEQRAQIAQVTEGRGQVVDTGELERFRAWQQTNRPAAQPDTSFLEDLDPEARAYVQRLQTDAARAQELESRPTPAQSADAIYELQRGEMEFRSGANQWMESRGLDAESGGQLFERMLHTGAIQAFMPKFTRRHAITGEQVGVDYQGLARAALDFTLVQDPELHSKVLTSAAAPPRQTTPPALAQKISRASSLATAPSASVSQPPTDPARMTPQEQNAGMAAMFRELTGAG